MQRTMGNVLLALFLALASRSALAGGTFLLDRELTMPADGGTPSGIVFVRDGEGCLAYLTVDGEIRPYRWVSPLLEAEEPFGSDVGSVMSVPADAEGQWLVSIARNTQEYQVWRRVAGAHERVAAGSFGGRVIAATGGRFAAGEGAGLFAQFDSGRIGYWQVGREGCLPVWLSPEPVAGVVGAHHGDLDGDGLDEVLTITAAGGVNVLRWHNGLWENVWALPPWGQVLGIDLGQADGKPGLEVAVVTSQRRLFLIGAESGVFTVRARFTTTMVASHIALLPEGNGTVLLCDAAGDLYLLLPEGESWREEAVWREHEKLAFLAGLGPERILAGTNTGTLRVLSLVALGKMTVFLDGMDVGNRGIFWDDGDFYFSQELLQRIGLRCRWDEKKATLTLTAGGPSVTMQAGKTDASIDGRAWLVGRALIMVGKAPYVPAALLRSVFSINVTHDPSANCLILTSSSAEAA